MQLGRLLVWDSANNAVTDDEAANRLLQRPYRGPWSHPSGAA